MLKPQTPPVKFLVVDDREENITALEALLRRDGLEILTARSGDQALELLLANDIALALLDVQMPDMDGFALAELMRGSERSRHVPIIFVTAAAREQHRIFQGYDAGAVDFLFKPIEPRILRHKAATFFDLYKQRQELAETLRINETFVAVLGHDLKNPINSIVVATELMIRLSLDADQKRYAERIRTSARRISGMVDDLFDLARVRLGGGIPLERKPIDLNTLVRSVAAEHTATAEGNAINVRNEGNTEGSWDPTRLGQIVSNLIGNAIRHGAKNTAVDISAIGQDGWVIFTVHNAGSIPVEIRHSLFDPFRSGEAKSKDGLGLGLFIVQQLVIAHRGTVEVESSEQAGTSFRVRLPRA